MNTTVERGKRELTAAQWIERLWAEGRERGGVHASWSDARLRAALTQTLERALCHASEAVFDAALDAVRAALREGIGAVLSGVSPRGLPLLRAAEVVDAELERCWRAARPERRLEGYERDGVAPVTVLRWSAAHHTAHLALRRLRASVTDGDVVVLHQGRTWWGEGRPAAAPAPALRLVREPSSAPTTSVAARRAA